MSRRRLWPAVLLIGAAAGGAAWRFWPAGIAEPAAAPPVLPIVRRATPATPWQPPAQPALPAVKKGGDSWRPQAEPVTNKVEAQRGAPDIPDAQPLPRPPDP
ncbi:hypothetical protein [Chromobacterium violaceum]|uniref:hypothetical protein n=1 Tax=Chromobacterium violaceum TaxID=536 RepID=UPI001C391050|nr:hypothetical protein [Chromobacterium violaceum]